MNLNKIPLLLFNCLVGSLKNSLIDTIGEGFVVNSVNRELLRFMSNLLSEDIFVTSFIIDALIMNLILLFVVFVIVLCRYLSYYLFFVIF